METNLYVVIFIRQDSLPNEDYYYYREDAAEEHFSLFKDDDSGLYKRIELIKNNTVVKVIAFQFIRPIMNVL